MGTRLSSLFPSGKQESCDQDRKESSLSRHVQEDEIAHFPYVEFTGQDSITCPTCQGTGQVQTGRMNELVALVPYSDQRLQPQRTKLYVLLSVIACILISVLVAFFSFPRAVLIEGNGFQSAQVRLDKNSSQVFITLMTTLNISNTNFYSVFIQSVSSEVFYLNTVIGTQKIENVSVIQPLSKKQVNFTVNAEIGGALHFVYNYCTEPSLVIHNIVIFMRTTVKVLYLKNKYQDSLEWYQYIDCGAHYSSI
ncbi:transmembrane protein 106C [Protopterus annectens]|uniref:transmembrane protein 106C n=1 Tax=Protopterus annectens TaxID=7888 RepID=UPI001CF9CD7D|nr:transmembrane protein 106C [Protopterus annectens]XP_043939810.1 transmembrane protein 106C [Protopterus annectens]XP_043939811.1 transmembrane protein 106C [Protopterus annectens]XP_043939813.1 transmembrane protein 106C [Protopterus annectens]XP_043939814.1 transmembrane protein 106C [Protopterus annectens]XP_043939815.1 transmembrane protein 106C [Protopterus annectens]